MPEWKAHNSTQVRGASGSPTRTDPLPPGYLEDGNTLVLAGQVANSSSYLGYALTTNVGVRWVREDLHAAPSSSELFSFITVFAGLGTDR